MKPGSHSLANGLTGRADLLRLLAIAPRPEMWLDDDGEHRFGYLQRDTPSGHDQTGSTIFDPQPVKPAVQTGNFKLPLHMPFVHVIAERQTRELLNPHENAAEITQVYEPISEDDAKAPEAKRLVNYQDLVPKARLLPALKRYLSSNRTSGLDVPRLVKQIAGQQLPRHLPRRQLKTWHPQWVVVLDFAKRLWPYRQDMHQLAEHLLHACGQSGVSIRILNHGPLQHWTDWVEEQQTGGALPAKNAWRMTPVDTPVLLVSDLGLLEGPDSTSHHAWQRFIRQLGKAQTRPLALVPLGAEQLDDGLPNNLALLRWSPDARIRPERALGKGQTVPDGINDLLAMAAATRRVDPPLVRAMRWLNPKAPLNAGLEGAFWCHADVEAGSAANIRYEAQAKHLAYFAQLLDDCQLELEQLRYRHHAHLRAVLNHEETLLWGAHAKLDGAKATAETYQRLVKAEAFMRQLAATLKQPDGLQKAGVWWTVAQDLINRTDQRMGECYADLFTPLVAAIAEVRGDFEQVPDWIYPAELKRHISGEKVQCWLVRDPLNGEIWLQRMPAIPYQSALGEPLTIDSGGIRIESADKRHWFSAPEFVNSLCRLNEETTVKLTTSTETLTLATLNRPRGAMAWDCNTSGVWVRSPELCGQSFEWSTSPIPIEPSLKTVLAENGQYQLVENSLTRQVDPRDLDKGTITYDYKENTASSVRFVLDEYGVRADLNVLNAPDAEAIQSLRWIEPGSFLMGSPDEELERYDDEGPQHEVTISRGFWLADTACTQDFWQAVMDDNPSGFKDNANQPVEKVSWHAVGEFLQRLQALLPRCQVDLPSEAEWEYACRAGTTTPFSFGANINRQQVNYWGSNLEPGENRTKTVAVKSLPANPWGLYEMHGNVWEWCKDGQRTYDQQAQVDPLGPLTGGDLPRAVRGGSWLNGGRGTRSANRYAARPGDANSSQGFRFCLRSIQSGQETGSPAGTPGRASGASQDEGRKGAKSKSKPGPKPEHRS